MHAYDNMEYTSFKSVDNQRLHFSGRRNNCQEQRKTTCFHMNKAEQKNRDQSSHFFSHASPQSTSGMTSSKDQLLRKYLSSGSWDAFFQTRVSWSTITCLRSKWVSRKSSSPPLCCWPCRQNMARKLHVMTQSHLISCRKESCGERTASLFLWSQASWITGLLGLS